MKMMIKMLSAVVSMAADPILAAGSVAEAIINTWNAAKEQIRSVTDNVIFPVIDVILAILLFVKIGLAYMDYRDHGKIEWVPIAIIFGCLLFSLTAPLYIWSIVNV